MKKNLKIKIYLLATFFLWGCLAVSPPSSVATQDPPDPVIRVAILNEVQELDISIRGRYKIINPLTQEELAKGRRLKGTKVLATPHGINIGADEFLTDRIRIIVTKDVALRIGDKDRRYRGELEIIKNKDGKFLVLNNLGLERYVKGVLYHEVSHRWPMSALMAQAIAARTYALYKASENADQIFDVTSDIYSQVYGGRSAERYRTNIAVNRTKGKVLIYAKDLFPAYFHANSGGHTEDVRELWKHDLPPLKGKPDDFSKSAPHYRWKRNFQSKDIQETLNRHGYNLGLIKTIEVLSRNESNRVRNLKIMTRDGNSITISGKKFRHLIGPNKVKSNSYTITMKGYYFDLIGNGWGHGVGMSQWGAHEMARQRYTYNEILQFYYPGTELVDHRIYDFPPKPPKPETKTNLSKS